jgi:hypothetical protein
MGIYASGGSLAARIGFWVGPPSGDPSGTSTQKVLP